MSRAQDVSLPSSQRMLGSTLLSLSMTNAAEKTKAKWVPAFAGTTGGGGVDWITQSPIAVIPAQAGIQFDSASAAPEARTKWIPAYAGMTFETTTVHGHTPCCHPFSSTSTS